MCVYVKLFATLRRYVDNAANGVPLEVDLAEDGRDEPERVGGLGLRLRESSREIAG